MSEPSRVIGLTGQIASGKGEVAKILHRQGAEVIDVDKLAHQLYKPQTQVWQNLVRAFGSKILKRGGEVNRKRLAELAFSHKSRLQELNRIVHPFLKEAVIQKIEEAKHKGKRLIVVDGAVLKEIGLLDYIDEVWVVMASQKIRLKRLLNLGFNKKEAILRLRSQASQEEYRKIADVVILNNGTLKQLHAKIQACL